MNKIICVIPARKGSKRLKNKNIKNFYGKPIISRVIQKLKKFKIFDNIYVSTDCNKIENIAKEIARPSMPSIKLNALTITKKIKTVVN